MSRARTGAHRPNQHERRQRRGAIEHLISRALRAALTVPEAAVLADYWRQEQRAADGTRRSLYDTTQALERHREAADAAIREAEQRAREFEQRALDAEEQLTAYRSVLGPRPLDTIRAAEQRAEQAERSAAGWEDTARTYAQDAEQYKARAEQAEAVTAETKRLMERRTTTLRQRAERAEQALARVRDAQRLGDALAAVAEHDGLTPQAAAVTAAYAEAADSTEARLAEQQREHEIALAKAQRRGDIWKAKAQEIEADRDRLAERAAMTAEAPYVEAGRRALDAFNRECATRAALADEAADAARAGHLAAEQQPVKAAPCRRHPMCPCDRCTTPARP